MSLTDKLLNSYESLRARLSMKEIKIFSTLLLLVFIVHNAIIRVTEKTCLSSLFDDDPDVHEGFASDGCVLKGYTRSDLKSCLNEERPMQDSSYTFYFIGEQRTKSLFLQFKDIAIEDKYSEFTASPDFSEAEYFYSVLNIRVVYNTKFNFTSFKTLVQEWLESKEYPVTLVMGLPMQLDSTSEESTTIEEFTAILNKNKLVLSILSQYTKVFWFLVLPNYNISANDVNMFIKSAEKVFEDTQLIHWKSVEVGGYAHQLNSTVPKMVNLLCDKHEKKDPRHLCCYFAALNNSLLIAVVTVAFVSALSVILFSFLKKVHAENQDNIRYFWRPSSSKAISIEKDLVIFSMNKEATPDNKQLEAYFEPSWKIIKMCLILGYFYVADRTDLFPRSLRKYDHLNFWLPFVLCGLLGCIFRGASKQNNTLHRDITDEWKGWMQIVILIYHISGASTVLPIYMEIRTLVSSYLFLTGFGHFIFYWSGKPMNFRRYCQVMVRMNILTVMLCVVMDRHYQFYYFVPLVSFWYTVLYITLILPPFLRIGENGKDVPSKLDYFLAFIRLGILYTAIVVISLSKDFFEFIFLSPIIKYFFMASDHTVREWWFRWNLDRFSLFYGMCFAFVYKAFLQWVSEGSKFDIISRLRGNKMAIIGIAMIFSYFSILIFCNNKVECNKFHPYVTVLPIIGYILARNGSELFLKVYSTFFASVGQVSLELFISQYHIWMASDAEAILVLFPHHPFLNGIAISVIFIMASYEIHDLTSYISNLIVPKEQLVILRNLTIISIFLVIRGFIF